MNCKYLGIFDDGSFIQCGDMHNKCPKTRGKRKITPYCWSIKKVNTDELYMVWSNEGGDKE